MRNKKIINIKHLGLFALLATVAVYGMDQEAPTTSESRASSSRAVPLIQVTTEDPAQSSHDVPVIHVHLDLDLDLANPELPVSKRDIGTQSDLTPQHDIGTQSDLTPQHDIGTQSDPTPQHAQTVEAVSLSKMAERALYNLTMAVGSLGGRAIYNVAVGLGKNIGGFIIENPKTAAVAALVGAMHLEPSSVAYLGHTAASVADTLINNCVTQEAMYQFSIFLGVQYGKYFLKRNPWTFVALGAGLAVAVYCEPTTFAASLCNSIDSYYWNTSYYWTCFTT